MVQSENATELDIHLALAQRLVLVALIPRADLARGDTVILAENDSNGSKITV